MVRKLFADGQTDAAAAGLGGTARGEKPFFHCRGKARPFISHLKNKLSTLPSKPQTHHLSRGSFIDRKSTRLNSSHTVISYAVFCLKKNIVWTISLTHDSTDIYLD